MGDLAEKLDAILRHMQNVDNRVAAMEASQREPPRVLQVGEGSGMSSYIPDAIPIVTAQRVNTTHTRPTMPTFPVEDEGSTAPRDGGPAQHAAIFADWQSLGQAFRDALPFDRYLQFRCGGKAHEQEKGRGSHRDNHRAASKFHLPMFDGSQKATAKSWVEKLDIYFQLNQMPEKEAIKMAALHLEGEAQDWWFHGMTTLGHSAVSTYAEFTRRVVERFDRKDPEQHFGELTKLR